MNKKKVVIVFGYVLTFHVNDFPFMKLDNLNDDLLCNELGILVDEGKEGKGTLELLWAFGYSQLALGMFFWRLTLYYTLWP
jgi:hypothetical protein